MKQTMDPVDNAQAEMLAKLVAKMVEDKLKPGDGRVDMPLWQVAALWDEAILGLRPGQEGARKDARGCVRHLRILFGYDTRHAWVSKGERLLCDRCGREYSEQTPAACSDRNKSRRGGLVIHWDGKDVHLGDQLSLSFIPSMAKRVVESLRKHHPDYSASYRNRLLCTSQSMLTWQWDRARNPLNGWVREDVKDRQRKGAFHTEQELEDFLQYAREELRDIATFAADYGCLRLGEVLFTRIDDIDWERAIYKLPSYRTKNGEAAKMPISERAMEIARRWRAKARRGNPYLFQHSDPGNDPTPCACETARSSFPHERGHLQLRTVQRWMKRASERSGLMFKIGDHDRRPSFHDMRRSGATILGRKLNGNLDGVMALGRWKTPGIARQYIQHDEEFVEDMRKRLAEAPPVEGPTFNELRQEDRKPPVKRTPAAKRAMASAGRARRKVAKR